MSDFKTVFPNAEQFDTMNEHLRRIHEALGGAANSDAKTDAIFATMLDGTNTTHVFTMWWPISNNGTDTKYKRLCRWFSMLAVAWQDKTYTLRWTRPEVSTSPEMTQLDDLAGFSPAALATDTADGGADWAEENPMTWYVRANAASLADGTMNVLAIDGEDGFDIGGDTAPVYTFSLALWLREWEDASYYYKSWRTTQRGGYWPYAGDVAPDNSKRPMTWHPTFGGSLDKNGYLTSGAGKPICNNTSATAGLTKARARNAYEGLWNDCDTKWLLDMWQLRHFNLENSGILEGCTSYYNDISVAVAETGVERVIVSKTDSARLIKGSTVSLFAGTYTGAETFGLKQITDIQSVTIGGTEYAAILIDNGGATFSTTTALHLCTMPWHRGSTEAVIGHRDGSRGNLTSGQYPARIAGVEVLDGAYVQGLDPLYNVTANADGSTFDYAIHECRNSEKLASSITSDYVNTGLKYIGMAAGWNAGYITDFIRTKLGILFPSKFGGSSAARYKSAFYGSYSAGVRCRWRFGNLGSGGVAGLACEFGNDSPARSNWDGAPRLAGSGKKRGEWTA